MCTPRVLTSSNEGRPCLGRRIKWIVENCERYTINEDGNHPDLVIISAKLKRGHEWVVVEKPRANFDEAVMEVFNTLQQQLQEGNARA